MIRQLHPTETEKEVHGERSLVATNIRARRSGWQGNPEAAVQARQTKHREGEWRCGVRPVDALRHTPCSHRTSHYTHYTLHKEHVACADVLAWPRPRPRVLFVPGSDRPAF